MNEIIKAVLETTRANATAQSAADTLHEIHGYVILADSFESSSDLQYVQDKLSEINVAGGFGESEDAIKAAMRGASDHIEKLLTAKLEIESAALADTQKQIEILTIDVSEERPTDHEILNVVALYFDVAERAAFDWLLTIDFDKLAKEIK